jgi:hypothetical protein
MTLPIRKLVGQTGVGQLRDAGVFLENCVLVRKGRTGVPQLWGGAARVSAAAGHPATRWS